MNRARAPSTGGGAHLTTGRAGRRLQAPLVQFTLSAKRDGPDRNTWLDRARSVAAFRRALLRWYARTARDLPWRRTRDPYRIWVSEVLLQQTRVEAGRRYYERFLQVFPTVRALAAAPLDRVLKLWAGLGYYSRARHLHAAARVIVRQHAGRLPRSSPQWAKLPGIGRYTAAAIASIAFGECVPAVDGNVKRVVARLLRIEEPIGQRSTEELIYRAAARLLSRTRPGMFNQAMMELGACVCLPRKPRCSVCPAARWCAARAAGREGLLPRRRPRPVPPLVHAVAVVLRRNGRYLLVQRQRGLLAGMWGWPSAELPDEHADDAVVQTALLTAARGADPNIQIGPGQRVSLVEHTFSHRRLCLHVYGCEVREAANPAAPAGDQRRATPPKGVATRGTRDSPSGRPPPNARWVRPRDISRYPLARVDQKVLACLTTGTSRSRAEQPKRATGRHAQ